MAELVEAAAGATAPSVIYGAGLENRPDLVDAAGRRARAARLPARGARRACAIRRARRLARDAAGLALSARTLAVRTRPRPRAAAGCASRCAAAAGAACGEWSGRELPDGVIVQERIDGAAVLRRRGRRRARGGRARRHRAADRPAVARRPRLRLVRQRDACATRFARRPRRRSARTWPPTSAWSGCSASTSSGTASARGWSRSTRGPTGSLELFGAPRRSTRTCDGVRRPAPRARRGAGGPAGKAIVYATDDTASATRATGRRAGSATCRTRASTSRPGTRSARCWRRAPAPEAVVAELDERAAALRAELRRPCRRLSGPPAAGAGWSARASRSSTTASSCRRAPARSATPGSPSASRRRRRWPASTARDAALDDALDAAAAILRGGARAAGLRPDADDDRGAAGGASRSPSAIGATIDPGAVGARVPGARREHGDARRDPARAARRRLARRPGDHAPAARAARGRSSWSRRPDRDVGGGRRARHRARGARGRGAVDAAGARPRRAHERLAWTLAPLAERLRGSPHTVLLHDVGDHLEALALHALVRDVAPRAHWSRCGCGATSTPPAPRTCWPGARATPARSASRRRARRRSATRRAWPSERPSSGATISIGPRPSEDARASRSPPRPPACTAPASTHRLDGVPVPLYAPLPSDRPGDDEVLEAIAGRLAHEPADRRRRASTTPPTAWTARCATSASTAATSSPSCPTHAPRIDARGMVVMPGGVDIHAHIAGPKVNLARKLAGPARRSARAAARPTPATATRCSATRP